MTKVYIVEKEDYPHGFSIQGVFSTHEQAEAYTKDKARQVKIWGSPVTLDDFEISEWEVE